MKHAKLKELPHADKLKHVGQEMKGVTCIKSRWLCVTYKENKTAPLTYYCLYCNKWVDPDEHTHIMQERPLPVFTLSPTTLKGGKANGRKRS